MTKTETENESIDFDTSLPPTKDEILARIGDMSPAERRELGKALGVDFGDDENRDMTERSWLLVCAHCGDIALWFLGGKPKIPTSVVGSRWNQDVDVSPDRSKPLCQSCRQPVPLDRGKFRSTPDERWGPSRVISVEDFEKGRKAAKAARKATAERWGVSERDVTRGREIPAGAIDATSVPLRDPRDAAAAITKQDFLAASDNLSEAEIARQAALPKHATQRVLTAAEATHVVAEADRQFGFTDIVRSRMRSRA